MHAGRRPAWEAELRAILVDRIAEIEPLRDLRLAQTSLERESLSILAIHGDDPALDRVRKAVRSIQNEQTRLRKALDAHRAANPVVEPEIGFVPAEAAETVPEEAAEVIVTPPARPRRARRAVAGRHEVETNHPNVIVSTPLVT